jgi:hypothetical protein
MYIEDSTFQWMVGQFYVWQCCFALNALHNTNGLKNKNTTGFQQDFSIDS